MQANGSYTLSNILPALANFLCALFKFKRITTLCGEKKTQPNPLEKAHFVKCCFFLKHKKAFSLKNSTC